MAEEYVVYGEQGTGSVAVEAALMLLAADYRVENVPEAQLSSIPNPMAQVPALLLPNGQLMTESAAILIWLADAHHRAPGAGD